MATVTTAATANGAKNGLKNGKPEASAANGSGHKAANEAEWGLSTRAIHSGTKPSDWTHGPIMPPIYLTTTYEVDEPGHAFYDYTRCNNPTREALHKYFASLESAKYALAFSSGLSAITAVTYLLNTGQHILCCDNVYGGTFRLLDKCVSRMGIETTFVDGTKLEEWERNFRVGKTKLVWLETPTNPMLTVIDIAAVVKLVKRLDKDCIVAVDNTFITSVFQSPLKLGADIVMHSCSKYMSGHSDIIMGALMTSDDKLHASLKFLSNSIGVAAPPYDSAIMMRSIKTLEVRVRQQTANAMQIAEYLEAHPLVDKVLYPGLKSHPQHELAASQCTGFGAMMSVYIKLISGDEPFKFMKAVRIFHPAESLGCVCSLIEIPALMTHASVPLEERLKLGITDGLLRISVGIENVKDQINDLESAFKEAYGTTK